MPKFCKDCRHCDQAGVSIDPDRWRCDAPANHVEPVSLVTGELTIWLPLCSNARLVENACGMEGKWFEINFTLAQKIIKESQPRLPKGKGFEIGKDI